MGSYRVCLCFTRSFWMAELETPAEVKAMFDKYADGGAYLTAEQLRRFLSAEQPAIGDVSPEKIVEDVLCKRHHIAKYTRFSLSLDDFFYYLFSVDLNPPFESQRVHQDMTAPLSHYFIFTGHNSYLTGNQLSSESSDIPIIRALQRGVRVIELDLWPNSSKKDEIQVLHGRTLTTPVDLLKCLQSIKEHAFVLSDYPVIITLEDHLTPKLQDKVAEMIIQTFGDMLYYPESDLKEFPSPTELMRKILISTKPPKESLEAQDPLKGKDADHEHPLTRAEDPTKGKDADHEHPLPRAEDPPKGKDADHEHPLPRAGDPPKRKDADHEHPLPCAKDPPEGKDADHEHPLPCAEDPPEGKDADHEHPLPRKNDIHEDEQNPSDPSDHDCGEVSQHFEPLTYKRLIAIHQRKKSKLDEALKIDPNKVVRVSFSEQKLEKAATSHGKDIVRFTQKNILRIYPKGTRFNSSNYCPFNGWMHGAQMVAFNMQGYGRSLWQMHGMFRANGGCGYVKKPDFLLDENHVFDPRAKLPVKTTLKVKVYMGDGWRMDFKKTYFDKYSPPDFYTKIGISGVPADETMHMTKVKDDQWIPVWNEEFTFPLTVPELALLRIQVYEHDNDKKDDFGGQTCLPVSELMPGTRAVPLYSHRGERYNSVKLLMRFTFV